MLTLSMIVKNEEKYLEDCLRSVESVVDEIVIVDTGSSDRTLDIAQKYKAKIFHFDWVNDFSAARNFALEKSTGDWILYLDADERLREKDKKKIKTLLLGSNKRSAFSLVVNSINEVNNRAEKMNYVRLFPNNPKIKFEGAAHEQIVPSLLKNNYKIVITGIEIIHLGYNISKEELQRKAERNLSILLEDYKNKKSSYVAFQIAQSYAMLDKEREAINYFSFSLKDAKLAKEFKSLAYRYIAAYEAKKFEWEKALENIKMSLNEDKRQPLSYFIAAKILLSIKNFPEADRYCRMALEANKQSTVEISSSITDYVILIDEKIILYLGLGVSINGKLKESFNFYYTELINLLKRNKDYFEIDFLYQIINNQEIKFDELKYYLNFISKDNLEVITELLKDYQFSSVKIKIIEELVKKFPNNSTLLNFLADENNRLGKQEIAERLFNQSIKEVPEDPRTYFALITFYIRTGKLYLALEIAEKAKYVFANVPEVLNRMEIIKNKIQGYL